MSAANTKSVSSVSPCPICAESGQLVFELNGFPVNECARCEHRFVDGAFDSKHTAASYDDGYFEGGGVGYPDYMRQERLVTEHGKRYAEIVGKHMSPGSMLDVGSAAGFIMNGFASHGWQCHGVEPNEKMAAVAQVAGHEMFAAPFEEFPSDLQFDLVGFNS